MIITKNGHMEIDPVQKYLSMFRLYQSYRPLSLKLFSDPSKKISLNYFMIGRGEVNAALGIKDLKGESENIQRRVMKSIVESNPYVLEKLNKVLSNACIVSLHSTSSLSEIFLEVLLEKLNMHDLPRLLNHKATSDEEKRIAAETLIFGSSGDDHLRKILLNGWIKNIGPILMHDMRKRGGLRWWEGPDIFVVENPTLIKDCVGKNYIMLDDSFSNNRTSMRSMFSTLVRYGVQPEHIYSFVAINESSMKIKTKKENTIMERIKISSYAFAQSRNTSQKSKELLDLPLDEGFICKDRNRANSVAGKIRNLVKRGVLKGRATQRKGADGTFIVYRIEE